MLVCSSIFIDALPSSWGSNLFFDANPALLHPLAAVLFGLPLASNDTPTKSVQTTLLLMVIFCVFVFDSASVTVTVYSPELKFVMSAVLVPLLHL